MATVVVNQPDLIEFKNLAPTGSAENAPTLTAQAGKWKNETGTETGIVIDAYGSEAPLLSPTDARKLAKWLVRAADSIDGVKTDKKKHKQHRHWDDQDGDDYDEY